MEAKGRISRRNTRVLMKMIPVQPTRGQILRTVPVEEHRMEERRMEERRTEEHRAEEQKRPLRMWRGFQRMRRGFPIAH